MLITNSEIILYSEIFYMIDALFHNTPGLLPDMIPSVPLYLQSSSTPGTYVQQCTPHSLHCCWKLISLGTTGTLFRTFPFPQTFLIHVCNHNQLAYAYLTSSSIITIQI